MTGNIDSEKHLIRQAWDYALAALADKSWEAYSGFWAHEPYIQVIHPAARDWTLGWERVALKYKAFMESPVKLSANTRTFDVNVAPSGDLAWVTIEAAISVNGVEHVSWQVLILRKHEGHWEAVLGFDAALPDVGKAETAV
jgi:hypothetical protein